MRTKPVLTEGITYIITYRELELSKAECIREIDASQFIANAWHEVNGVRQFVAINYHDADFPNGYENHLESIKDTIKRHGSALGAFDNRKLIGY